MKRFEIITLYTVLTLFISVHSYFAQVQADSGKKKNQTKLTEARENNLDSADQNNEQIVYQCQIDLEVLSNVPVNCSKCGLKLKEFTMEEALNNLIAAGHKKPELKLKYLFMTEEEETETEEIQDTVDNSEGVAVIDVLEMDKNGNGYVFQCPKCPDQILDTEENCPVCGADMDEYTVDAAKKNLAEMDKAEKDDETVNGVSASPK